MKNTRYNAIQNRFLTPVKPGLHAAMLYMAGLATGLFILTGCEIFQEPEANTHKTITMVTWNVQTLFDGSDAGTEYDDYRIGAGWSKEKYQARLTSIAEAVERMAEKPPDILALQEIENGNILKDLSQGTLAKPGYGWTFFANNPGAALGLGVLSRLPLIQARAHSINRDGETAPRPILELRIEYEEKPLILFVCHWKSKQGGDDATESLRRDSARIILRRLKELTRDEPELPAIIMGDLNECYDEFYRRAGMIVSALLPDDPMAAELSGFNGEGEAPEPQDFIVLSRQKPPRSQYFTSHTMALYSPWGNELQKGSYYYRNEWETIDHVLLTSGFFDRQGWEFESCEVLHKEPFINNGNGYPNSYNPRTGYGQSDHLPLLLTLSLY